MKSLELANRTIVTNNCSFVMGIINANDDSFYSESRTNKNTQIGIDKALEMIESGADILDIGAESTRPGAQYINENQEIDSLVPIIEGIRKYNKDIAISIDTRKTKVIEQCYLSGADILNDVSALEDGENICEFVSKSNIPVILMHKRGIPVSMQKQKEYADVIKEVSEYLISRANFAVANGIKPDKIIFDPGIGFGKNLQSNLELISNVGKLTSSWNNGNNLILMALSRKTCIGEILNKTSDQRLTGSLIAEMYAILKGASIVRVHDVEQTVDAVKVLSALIERG